MRLVNAAFMAERPFIKGDRINAEGVEEMLARGTFLLAEQGGILVACVFVNPQGERAHLGLVSVDPAMQGRGLGSRLMAAVEVYCRTAGYCEMELRFINHRTEFSQFYQKMGYAETGVTGTTARPNASQSPLSLRADVQAAGMKEAKAGWCNRSYVQACVLRELLLHPCRIRLGRNLYENDRATSSFSRLEAGCRTE